MKKISLIVKPAVIAIALMALKLGSASGQVGILQDWTNVYHGTSSLLQNINYTVPAGSNANRVLVVAIASSRSSSGPMSVTLTYGGQTLTSANGDMGSSTRQHSGLYYLNEAGLDAAALNTTLSVTVTGGTICITDVWAAVFDYVNQTDPITNSRTYSSGTATVSTFAFGTALTINAYNQAVEIVSSVRSAKSQASVIKYAQDWTMIDDSTAFYLNGLSGYSIRNGVANRTIPESNVSDVSSTSLDKVAVVSMTGLSLNFEMPEEPTLQASNITFTNVTSSSFTINWTSGNGTNRIVLVKAGSPVDGNPVNGTIYTASNLFGSGSLIETGNYVVYDGTGNSVTVYNLDGNTTYHVAVYEFSRPGTARVYLTSPPPATGSQLTETGSDEEGDYRSKGSGDWGIAATWQRYNGASWVEALTAPTPADNIVTIRTGHTITVTATAAIDQIIIMTGGQVTVNSGVTWTIENDLDDDVDCMVNGTLFNSGTIITSGVLAFSSGSVYQHASNGGTIPAATWDANSLCLVTGITDTAPTGFGQSFGRFTWNCPSQTSNVLMNSDVTVQGDFRLTSTGSGKLAITDGTTSMTLTVMGNYYQTGGTLDLNNGLPSTAITYLAVAGNFSFTGGTITEASSQGSGAILFNGSNQMQIYTSGGTLNNTVSFVVESGAYLQMGTGLNPSYISDSKGSFTLSPGATLGITDRYGITAGTTGPTGGNIRVTGARNFDTGANYVYNGSVNQNSGDGLPLTVSNLVFDNTVGPVTFNASRIISNNFAITAGSKANLGTFTHTTSALTLGGVGQTGGTYGGTGSGALYEVPDYFIATAGIVINQATAGTWLGITTDWFTASNWIGGVPESDTDARIYSFTTNQPVISGTNEALSNTISINPGASLTVAPNGKATFNTVINNGTITLASDASGMFSLKLETYSGTTGTVNTGVFLTGGDAGNEMYRWHYLAVPSQQSKSVLTDINAENLMWYNEPAAQTDMWDGWNWHDGFDGTTPISNLMPTEGYSFYHDEDAYVTYSGNSLLTTLPSRTLSFTTFGWNFIGNSLTCGLSWDEVIFAGDVDPTVHFLKDYQEYYYMENGPSSPYGNYAGHIPPLQGFFVKANAAGASLDFSGAREHNDTPYYKGSFGNSDNKSPFPVIRLALGNDNHSDETVIWFSENSTMDYDSGSDAEKFIYEGTRPQVYSYSKDTKYAINGIPSPEKSVEIPIAFSAPENGKYSISRIQMENVEGYAFYLKDLVLNTKVSLNNTDKYTFSATKGTVKNRFVLAIENLSAIPEENAINKPFSIYYSFGLLSIEPLSDAWDGRTGSVKVYDLAGRIVADLRNVAFSRSSLIQMPIVGNKGLLIVEMSASNLRHTGRVVVK